jgi:hypothetical protein
VDNVGIDVGVDDGAAKVIGSSNIVVDGVSLCLGILLGVRGCTLFRKVDNRIRLLVLDQLHEKVVVFGYVEVVERNFLSGDLLPCLDTRLSSN